MNTPPPPPTHTHNQLAILQICEEVFSEHANYWKETTQEETKLPKQQDKL